jgi:hypothetical protein
MLRPHPAYPDRAPYILAQRERTGLLASFSTRQTSVAILLLVWLISAAYLAVNLNRGWVPHDEGILGQSAERVLHGELPHRDFNEPYTGGLAYLDAAAFRIFGVNLMVLRWVLFAFFLLWVPAVFAIAREFCAPLPAAGVTLLSVAWSVPNYPAAMPSWFCLFLATFGVLALLRYLRAPHPLWLILAGLCGGFSFLMKTPGLYYVAGVLLFLIFREQSLSRPAAVPSQADSPRANARPRSTAYVFFVALSLLLFLLVLARMVLPRGGVSEFLHFVFPALAISGLLLVRERFPASSGNLARFGQLFSLAGPFLAGVALPILLYLVFYWRAGALHPLLTSLFVTQLSRLADARLPPPHWVFALCAIPLALFLFQKRGSSQRPLLSGVLKILAALLLLLACRKYVVVLFLTLNSPRAAFPVFTLAAAWLLYARQKNAASDSRDQRLMLLISVAAMCGLVQFPYAGPLYFCYFATIALLALVALLSLLPPRRRSNLLLAGAFFTLLAAFVFRPVTLASFAFQKRAELPDTPLALPRTGGLRVFPDHAARYQQLIQFLLQLSPHEPILAAPDCPEVYFLSGLRNPTPFFFDFFAPPAEYRAYLEQLLDRPGSIKVVVLNNDPAFSLTHRDILRSLVVARFPQSRKFDNFEIFWRP